MSDFKNKLLSISGEITREQQLENLNEDHKLIVRNNELESRLQEAFAKIMREIQNFEYSLGGYMSLPYGKVNPSKVIEQARNNELQYKKLKAMAYQRMEELKQVIDEVFCPDDYEKKKEMGTTSLEIKKPGMEIEVGTTDDLSSSKEVPFYSKRDKKKKRFC